MKVGQHVFYHQGDDERSLHHEGDERFPDAPGHPGTNGTRVHPAVVTRDLEDGAMNLIVFLDAAGPVVRTGVPSKPEGEDPHASAAAPVPTEEGAEPPVLAPTTSYWFE